MEQWAKRKYTVSAKVIAANRANLEKARAVPKAIRFRSTERRRAACRQNLLKANAGRRPAAMPRRHPARGRSLWRMTRPWGEAALGWLKAQAARVVRILDPFGREEEKLAHGMAEGLGRWLALARDRTERERQGLLRTWASAPEDEMAAAHLGCRLLGLFGEDLWREQALARLRLRLERLAREFWLQRNLPARAMSEALEEVTARDLGNPFRPWRSTKMAALLREPVAEMYVGSSLVLPELPGEEANPLEAAFNRKRGSAKLPVAENSARRAVAAMSSSPEVAMSAAPGSAPCVWPSDFRDYRRLVERSLGAVKAGPRLPACIERIARLSWERYQVAEREYQRLAAAFEEALKSCYVHMRSEEMMERVLSILTATGQETAEDGAEQLEEELAAAFQEYLCCRYGPHPAFKRVCRPRRTTPSRSERPASPVRRCKPIYVITKIS